MQRNNAAVSSISNPFRGDDDDTTTVKWGERRSIAWYAFPSLPATAREAVNVSDIICLKSINILAHTARMHSISFPFRSRVFFCFGGSGKDYLFLPQTPNHKKGKDVRG